MVLSLSGLMKWCSLRASLTCIRAFWVVCFITSSSVFFPYKKKLARDQQEDPQPEDEAALPLQAGLSEQMLEAAIGHGPRPLNPASRIGCTVVNSKANRLVHVDTADKGVSRCGFSPYTKTTLFARGTRVIGADGNGPSANRTAFSLPLATRTEVGRAADQPGDLGLHDRLRAHPAGKLGAAVHGVLGQEAPLQAQDGPITGVEARALQPDRRGQDLADRPVQPVELGA